MKEENKRFSTMVRDSTSIRGVQPYSLDLVNELPVGQLINERYRIIRLLGKGSFASVYLCYDNKLEIEKVLKVFPNGADYAIAIRSLTNESKILIKLNHPLLIRVYDFEILSEMAYLDMEYFEANSLADVLQLKHFSRRKSIALAKQIAEGISYAHQQGVYHRDLKPANILINAKEQIRITDFGIASDKDTDSPIKAETVGFLPPEKGEYLSPLQQDVFAFGVTLFWIRYGYHPFTFINEKEIDYSLPPFLLNKTDAFDVLIRKCLAYYTEDRYQDFQLILQDLTQIQNTKKQILTQIKSKITRLVPLHNWDKKRKRDILLLFLLMGAFLLSIWLFLLILRDYIPSQKQIDITSVPGYLYVNDQFSGIPPLKTTLKLGDEVELKDSFGEPIVSFTYNGQDSLRIETKRNKIFINHKLIGTKVINKQDLPLHKNLQYIRTHILLSKKDFIRQKHKLLHISIGREVGETILSALPKQIRYLDLSKNRHIRSLLFLNKFKRLRHLNISDMPHLDHRTVPHEFRIKSSKHSFLHQFNPVQPLHITDIKTLNDTTSATQRSIRDTHIPAFSSIPVDKRVNSNGIAKNIQSLGRVADTGIVKRIIISKKHNLLEKMLVFFIVLVGMLSLFLLFRTILQLFSKRNKNKIIKKHNLNIDPKNKDLTRAPDSIIDYIESKLHDKKYYEPAEDNALAAIKHYLPMYPKDKRLKRLKVQVNNAIAEKIKKHYAMREFEPCWLTSEQCNSILPSRSWTQWALRIKKRISRKDAIQYRFIKGGLFEMGSWNDREPENCNPAHIVRISDYFISETPVTNYQYCEFLNEVGNQTEFGASWLKIDSPYCMIQFRNGKFVIRDGYEDYPVIMVSWYGALRFCQWQGGLLPSEAQWEFAARCRGKKKVFATGRSISRMKANYLIDIKDPSWHSVFPVKTYKPNSLGLYEMSGNIMEWCIDFYDKEYYKTEAEKDPIGPNTGDSRSIRGGAWCLTLEHCKTYYRESAKPVTRNNFIGFRVCKKG